MDHLIRILIRVLDHRHIKVKRYALDYMARVMHERRDDMCVYVGQAAGECHGCACTCTHGMNVAYGYACLVCDMCPALLLAL